LRTKESFPFFSPEYFPSYSKKRIFKIIKTDLRNQMESTIQEPLTKNRHIWVDLIRIIAIFAVVAIHEILSDLPGIRSH
jgi:hypothetical protein